MVGVEEAGGFGVDECEHERGPFVGIRVSEVLINDISCDVFSHLWDYGVSESSQSVHPGGNPMSQSTHVGFSCPVACESWITYPLRFIFL